MNSENGAKITISLKRESIESWFFEVVVQDGADTHTLVVELEKDYHGEHYGVNAIPLLVVQNSITYLLERELASAILKEFNIKEISTYFPSYEDDIKKTFGIN